jgi:hypothetical protein
MENIKKEAINFSRPFATTSSSRKIAQNSLVTKVNDYRTDRTKLYFLTELRKIISDNKEGHEVNCKAENCQTSQNYDTALFVIDEELEVLSQYFAPEISQKETFSYENMANLQRKLDEILEQFQKVEFGHIIIHEEVEKVSEELDTLKQYFTNMDKKSWFQLAYVKLVGIGVSYGVEETVVKGMFNELINQVENGSNYLIGK